MSKTTLKTLIVLVLITFSTSTFSQNLDCGYTVYDPIGNRFFCNNDNFSIIEIDPNGNLSYFGEGLKSALGMTIIGNHLFTIKRTDFDQDGFPLLKKIKIYDLNTELEINTFLLPNSNTLEFLTTDGVSKVWVSDAQKREIYEIDVSDVMNPVAQLIHNSPMAPIQGLVYDKFNNRLVFGSVSFDDTDAGIYQVDLSDNSFSEIIKANGIDFFSGITIDQTGNFYTIAISPDQVNKYSNDFSSEEIINIPGLEEHSGLAIANEIDVLAIPAYLNPEIILWPLNALSTTEISKTNDEIVSLSPNPSKDISILKTSITNWKTINYTLSNIQGQVIQQKKFNKTEQQEIKLDLRSFHNGIYLASFSIDNGPIINKKIVLNH